MRNDSRPTRTLHGTPAIPNSLFHIPCSTFLLVCLLLPTGCVATAESRLDWWRDARFGMFIHWGPVSLAGTEISWSRQGARPGMNSPENGIPATEYDTLYRRFDPVRFDADEWVRIAKDAGMRYLVFTAKHHDGFANFDSRLTDYRITSPDSPFGRDIVGELSDACHRAGLPLGIYYSQPDWHHPDYRTDRHAQYIEYLHGQLDELCTNYGKLNIIWFDGLGGKAEDWEAERLLERIRHRQPHVIINNRCGLPGDFDTPEQRIGSFRIDRPWETCMTLGKQWAFKPDDELKSLADCIRTLVRVVGGDGNFLLNVGPMPDGRIEPRQAERLREMGRWLERFGRSVYATRGGPFKPGPWGVSTHRESRVYVHVLEWPDGRVELPPIPARIVKSSVLTRGAVNVTVTRDGISIEVPPRDRDEIDTVVVLDLDRPAGGIAPVSRGTLSLAHRRHATASNVFRELPEYQPDLALDDDPSTRWATDAGTRSAWLEVDLGEERTIDRAEIHEAYPGRVERFELQYERQGAWETFHRGTTIGDRAVLRFEPVTARRVRLNILEASKGPTIREFLLLAPSN